MAAQSFVRSLASVTRVSAKSADGQGILQALGSAIREQRRRAGLSQEALAHDANLDRSHMGKIERGERNVTLVNLLRIAAALNVRPSILLSQAGY